ncbi:MULTISPECIES: helix-turn-helix domain-containing protein [Burkholderia]|uniref:helix-turn-helix domain-containing protein n=1 Tax=Burkholderia TaxID=32008 RepID=UPI00158C60EE|nr:MULTISPECIES: helix-turn-helix domain-containing protein [Burkholderia]MCA8197362.1 helix-turn-helix domain-containing protein [Burkholderia vietnamiensis]MCA8228184.1 helix-turn-helix domain-containing protein [Burkholderia vietnamiensis]UEC05578.1 helix-turn-helix domain-containing protein [Burkholderia vietnamiensis]
MSVTEESVEVILNRFGRTELTGNDLFAIRNDVLRLTQDQLAKEWDISRTYVSRIENSDKPSRREADMYRGLLMRRYFFRNF